MGTNDTPPAYEKQALLEVVMREATFTLATKHQAPETPKRRSSCDIEGWLSARSGPRWAIRKQYTWSRVD